jgi:hypothetical protein
VHRPAALGRSGRIGFAFHHITLRNSSSPYLLVNSNPKIGIPKTIEHVAIMCEGGAADEVTAKLSVAKELWLVDTG